MTNRDQVKEDSSLLDEDWTSPNALKSIVLVAALIAFFFVLSLLAPSLDTRPQQTQLESPQPFVRAE